MPKKSPNFQEPADHEIAACAYHIWESEGYPRGREAAHWFQAKAQLSATRKADAGLLKTKAIEPKAGRPAKNGSNGSKPPKARQSSRLVTAA